MKSPTKPPHRYSGVGVSGIYGSLSEDALIAEMKAHGIAPAERFIERRAFSNMNVIDMTDPRNLSRFGVTEQTLTIPGNHVTSQIIGKYVQSAGYDGLVYRSATSPGKHIVFFKTIK